MTVVEELEQRLSNQQQFGFPVDAAGPILARAAGVFGHPVTAEQLIAAGNIAANLHRLAVESHLIERTGNVVQSGPFAGMRCLPAYGGSVYAPRLLGTYEEELTPIWDAAPPLVVDVGAAEGYYAVGLARRGHRVIAYEADPALAAICGRNAELNGVAVEMRGAAGPDFLTETPALVIMDIEGAETAVLSAMPADRRARADFVIETHTVARRPTAPDVARLLEPTHEVTVIWQQPRDPSGHPLISRLTQYQQFLAMWEGRGIDPWLWCRRRAAG